MRVLGNSGSDPKKFVVEVDKRELDVFKGLCMPPRKVYDSPNHNSQAIGSMCDEVVEEKVFTTDEILDSYLAKKISKDEMVAMMNEARRD